MDEPWLDSREAARRLGVKPASLYAYVSRGQLRRRTAPDGRRSEYDPADVAALAVRGRRARPGRPTDVLVPTAVTAITSAGPSYRGVLATELAGVSSFEEVADHLWAEVEDTPWSAPAAVRDAVAETAGRPPGPIDAGQRLLASALAARAVDPVGRGLRPAVVRNTARGLLVALSSSLGVAPAAGTSIAEAVARGLGATADEAAVRGVDAALVLLADHELAASTLAARVAASARCDPYAVEVAGLAVLSGPRHGAASRTTEVSLAAIDGGTSPTQALARQFDVDGAAAGFGHPLYPDGDPRASRLLAVMEEEGISTPADPLRTLLEIAQERGLPPPNIDTVVAGLTHALGAPPGSSEFIFAIARTAGWMAHALEQYAEPQLLRPKGVYVGP